MSHAKQVSKRKRRTKAVTALGVAGLLSLTGGASAENVDLAKDTSTENAAAHHGITLEEEEISDNAPAPNPARHRDENCWISLHVKGGKVSAFRRSVPGNSELCQG
jgi:hypothetical protein